MSECVCKYYHSENGSCGFGVFEEFGDAFNDISDDPDICTGPECQHGIYEEATYEYDFEPTELMPEYGVINWKLAFSMP